MILLNDFAKQWESVGPEVLQAFERTARSGWFILGKEVETFEKSLASYWGLKHCVGVASGLDAIEIALRAAGLKPGDKVLTTPLSAFATTLAILRAGGVPVFVDVDESGLLDLGKAEQCLSTEKDIRFAVPVHLYGRPLDLTRLEALRDRFGLTIIEDCAQSIGARFGGRPTGSVGKAAATSFYPTKNLGALGDGGALLTNDDELCRTARKLRDYGQSSRYVHDVFGLNSRLDEVQAAILGVHLRKLDGWTRKRREIAGRYLSEIRNPRLRCASPADQGIESAFHLFPLVLPEAKLRTGFLDYLKSSGIQAAIHYPRLITDQEALQGFRHAVRGELTSAKHFAECEVSLPIHPFLGSEEVARVSEACNQWKG